MHAVLRSTWGEPRPHHPPRRVWRDWALVGALVPAAALEMALRSDLPWPGLWAVVVIGLAPTLLWRRTRPLLVLVIAMAATGLVPLLTGERVEPYTTAFVLILVYSVVRWGSGREAVVGLAIVLGGVCVSIALRRLAPVDAIGGLTVMFTATALGVAMRYRARLRTRELDQAKLVERERLARDLHDTVAHHVSAIAIRAQAGLATAVTQPDAATDALRLIEAEASRALTEMRAMVRVLRRDEPVDLAPSPRIADLGQLATSTRTGPSVEVGLAGDLDGVHPSVDAAVYRLAQEAVTNARRHARHATRIEVRVDADDTSVHLRVSDDGDPSAGTADEPGYGLIGMVERVDLLGGTCTAGPDRDRGWTVTATLPRTGTGA
ncbi:sensor histidine kinase [Saccharothrix luteola]|uniref:sensor histidine kinase n=1 Tax=Saccharothrix luteola TaxID=2893018 RepID=UPI001E61F3FC|nr:sensor histidine kinase [Saccharothrix luteola]MCC8244047.1 sensor histidine kinase [Saccharothrix luteola]